MLLPRDYYAAPSLQLPITEPCARAGPPHEKLVSRVLSRGLAAGCVVASGPICSQKL